MFYPGVKKRPKTTLGRRYFYELKGGGKQLRFGPHNEEMLSILVGSLLGNAHGEKRYNSTRVHYNMKTKNMEYVRWLYGKLQENGYCGAKALDTSKKMIKFNTYSFSSLNFLYDLFYDRFYNEGPIGRKRLRHQDMEELKRYFTPLAFAVWYMDDGGYYIYDDMTWVDKALKIIPSPGLTYFSEEWQQPQTDILRFIIKEKYNIETHYVFENHRELILFKPKEIPKLRRVIGRYVLPSLQHKLYIPKYKRKKMRIKRRRSLFLDLDMSEHGGN